MRPPKGHWRPKATASATHRSSGINAQGLVIDAGMGINYFDQQLVRPDRT